MKTNTCKTRQGSIKMSSEEEWLKEKVNNFGTGQMKKLCKGLQVHRQSGIKGLQPWITMNICYIETSMLYLYLEMGVTMFNMHQYANQEIEYAAQHTKDKFLLPCKIITCAL